MPQTEGRNRRIALAARPRGMNAPAAFIGLLEGRNFGKVIVRFGDT